MRLPWLSSSRRVRLKPLLYVPFVGRETLLSELGRHLQVAREGTAQYVVLEGPNGSGKSALLTEFAHTHCATAQVLLVQLPAGECLLGQEFYTRLFGTLQAQSEKILQTLYNDTKRLRRTLAVTWDEAEFRHVLTSADWTQLQEQQGHSGPRRAAPLAELLTVVRQHPWAVGVATMLDAATRQRVMSQRSWPQRWTTLLRAIQTRHLPPGAVLVLLIDQLPAEHAGSPDTMQVWTQHWQEFVQAMAGEVPPLLVVWTGTAEGLQPVRQALPGTVPRTEHRLEELGDEDLQRLMPRLQRALPRLAREPWQRLVATDGIRIRHPASLLLAVNCIAAMAEQQQRAGVEAPPSLAEADAIACVTHLVQAIIQRYPAEEGLFRQLLEICAFFPPNRDFVVDDILPLCDMDALKLDVVTGRAMLETLLGACVRYGLLAYDPYAVRYTTGNSLIQQTLQELLYPVAPVRQAVARQRQVAAAVMHHMQHGDSEILGELVGLIDTTGGANASTLLAPYLVAPLCRRLSQSTKAERQHIAGALGKFPSPLALDVLRVLLSDEEGQVRSRAAQSLADLQGLETVPVLLKARQDSNGDVRWIVAQALGKLEGAATVEALIELLVDEDKEVSRIAAKGLGQKGDRRAVPHLIAALRDSYPLLRESAALALGQLADTRALPALQELLQDANPQVRRRAETVLARLLPAAC
jgi:hypothetical protein